MVLTNLGKEQKEMIELIKKYKTQALTSFSLYQFAMYLLINEPDKQKAIRTLRDETNNTKRMRTPDKNYFYIHESYPEDIELKLKKSKLFPVKPTVHNLVDIEGRWNGYVEEVMAKLSSKNNVRTSFNQVIIDMWHQQSKRKNHEKILNAKVDELIDTLMVNRYVWWDVTDLDTIIKVAFCSFLKIDGIIHLIGCGFTQEKVQKKVNLFGNFLGVSLIFSILCAILYFNRQYVKKYIYFIIYILLALISTTLIGLSHKPAGSTDKELYEKRILNNIAIGIAGTSVTIMLASSFLFFKDKDIQQIFQDNLLLSLLVITLSAILQPNKNDIESIMRTKQLQLVNLNIAFYFILVALIIYLSNL